MSSVATEDEGTPCECLAIYNTVMAFKDHLQNVFVDKGDAILVTSEGILVTSDERMNVGVKKKKMKKGSPIF